MFTIKIVWNFSTERVCILNNWISKMLLSRTLDYYYLTSREDMQIFVENIEDDILFLTFYRFSW